MQKLYITLTHTGTLLSRIIKVFTKDEFSHISIALDEELEEMYSFGRLHAYNPFWGGFVHEGIDTGTFKRFRNTRTEIYSIYVTEEQFEKVGKIVSHFTENKQKYKFNFIGLSPCTPADRRNRRSPARHRAWPQSQVLPVSGRHPDRPFQRAAVLF